MKNLWRHLVTIAALLACTLSSAGTITYYHNDIAGSPIAATNESGAVLWRESYRPYGERLTNAPASAPNDVWFTSRRQDVDTGLVYMGARYYDPVIGRFMSTDPLGFEEANLHSFNRYAYANNNPYRYFDPSGESASLITRAALGVVAAFGIGAAQQSPEERRRSVEATQQAARGLFGIFNESNSEDTPKSGEGKPTRNSNPMEGEPGSCSTCTNEKGNKKQDRYYGADGWPQKDIDYDHAHKGDDGKKGAQPHAHDWSRPEDGGRPTRENRGPSRPLQPGE